MSKEEPEDLGKQQKETRKGELTSSASSTKKELAVSDQSKGQDTSGIAGPSSVRQAEVTAEKPHFEIFQVPHHGSSKGFYATHKDEKRDNFNKLVIHMINEFYCQFTSSVYVINADNKGTYKLSSGYGPDKDFGHPHPSTLAAIIMAHVMNKNPQKKEIEIRCSTVGGISFDKVEKVSKVLRSVYASNKTAFAWKDETDIGKKVSIKRIKGSQPFSKYDVITFESELNWKLTSWDGGKKVKEIAI